MALALGTNSGFVTTAPTADPNGTATTIDGSSVVTKHTSPAGSVRITEIGWYRASGTNAANWEIALYADSSGVAGSRLFVDNTNSSTTAGWKVVAVDWSISANTAYWLGLQMDSHTGSSTLDRADAGGAGSDIMTGQTTLNNPYGGGAVADADGMYAIYALVEIADTTDDLLADDLASGTPTLTSPVIHQTHALNANDVASGTPTLTAATLHQVHALLADDISAGVPTLSSPSLTEQAADHLSADDLTTGAPTLGSPALGQVHALTADDASSGTPTLTAPAIGQVHALSADDISTAQPTVTVPALGQSHALTADGIASGQPELTSPAIGQAHALLGDGIDAGAPVLSEPTLLENAPGVDNLLADDIDAGAPTLSSPAIGQAHALLGDGIATGAPELTSPSLAQVAATTGASGSRRLAVIELLESIEAKQKEAFEQGVLALFEAAQDPGKRGGGDVAESVATDKAGKPALETGERRVAPVRPAPAPDLNEMHRRVAAARASADLSALAAKLMAEPLPAQPEVVEFDEEEELALLIMMAA